ncbi:MAG: PEP-CTERM sorting domain-containing protein [Phycisphaerae bacterium]|nr:PEP-CTERM sorting domain-containing protein [Phycisphaerae bacterium]
MLKNISMVCVLCAITMLASTATGGSLIDEDFSTVTLQGAMEMMPLDSNFANTWATASRGGPPWLADGSVALISQSQSQGPMSPDQVAGMFYYLARPAGGDWGGNQLTLSFDQSQTFTTFPATAAYGLYGWNTAALDLTSSGDLTPLASDLMIPSPVPTPVVDGFTGNLNGFEYIGVLFVQSMSGDADHSHTTTIDNVSLTLTPEPMSMSLLALGGIALLRRRRRRA